MLALLDKATFSSMSQAVCFPLAHRTSSRAFGILCASCEKGFALAPENNRAVGAVFYDWDPTWQHAIVPGALSRTVTLQLQT